jgi:hypothetical protein
MLSLQLPPSSSMSSLVDPEACLVTSSCSCQPGETYANTKWGPEFYQTLDEVLTAYRNMQAEWKPCSCHQPPRPQGRRYGALHIRGKHILKVDLPGYGSVARCFAGHEPPWPYP